MRVILLLFATTLCSCPVFAQQSPMELALQSKLLNELSASLQCSAAAIDLQRKLAEAQAEIEKLKQR